MAYTYNCRRCGTVSRPYFFRAGAEGHGVQHRRRRHDGDYPVGEHIRRIAWINLSARGAGWRPSGGDVVSAAIAGLLVLWSVWHAFTN